MKWIIILVMTTSWVSALPRKQGKFSLFSVVTFKNEECTTTMDAAMNGICQTSEECTSGGGTASGNCASGFGVCCFYSLDDCETDVTNNVTYIQQDGFPTVFVPGAATTPPAGTACNYDVVGTSDICQIRFDFVAGTFMDPSATGVCGATADAVTITSPQYTAGQLTPTGALCGVLTGQHVYVESGRATPAATLNIAFGTTAGFNMRTWKIKVTLIECDNPGRAPTGCTQYFTGASGVFSSFNKDAGMATGEMLANQQYSICIRREKGMCAWSFQEAIAGTSSFQIATATLNGAATACTQQGLWVGPVCFAGGVLGTAADTASGVQQAAFPAVLIYRSTSTAAGTAAAATGFGYELRYTQTGCN